jgi:hypothetical protein
MSRQKSFVFALALLVGTLLPSAGLAQVPPFAVGGENVESETSLTPFKIRLRGVINATAKGESLGFISLWINDYREKYDFDVVTAQAVDNARIPSSAILRQFKDRKADLKIDGPKELLSKIGQAEPGTPLTIVGYLRQRNRTLQLLDVETMAASVGKR